MLYCTSFVGHHITFSKYDLIILQDNNNNNINNNNSNNVQISYRALNPAIAGQYAVQKVLLGKK